MDLTPLYELRNRLKNGAIAGTELLGEDFRLTRALEAMAPLESASPVFQKIAQSVRLLLSPDCTDRPSALLDCLSLCDAVLVTQGTIATTGDITPLTLFEGGNLIVNAPYSVLNPLIEALTTSGSGHYSFVVDTHQSNPELFHDYRIKSALVDALGASYSELADKAKEWLSGESLDVIPLLKANFDPMGKRAMVRRINVIENITGASENDFYLSLLENSDKDIRTAAIYALRHDKKNAEQLITLCKTEKGNAKKSAHWALASIDVPIASEYWQAIYNKKPEQAMEYMTLTTTDFSAKLVGTALCNFIAPFENNSGEWTDESAAILQSLLHALNGKCCPEILSFYRRVVLLGNKFNTAPNAKKNEEYHFSIFPGGYYNLHEVFTVVLPEILSYSLVLNPNPELCALAEELYSKYGGIWVIPALTSILLTRNSNDVFIALQDMIKPISHLFGQKEKNKNLAVVVKTLGKLVFNTNTGKCEFSLWYWDAIADNGVLKSRPIYAPLDKKCFAEFTEHGTDFNDIIIKLIGAVEEKDKIASHLYKSALITSDNQKYILPLKQLGWTNYKGLFARHCKDQKRLSHWSLQYYLNMMPISDKERLAELNEAFSYANTLLARGSNSFKDMEALIKEYQEKVQ